jgi:hypothetical protein
MIRTWEDSPSRGWENSIYRAWDSGDIVIPEFITATELSISGVLIGLQIPSIESITSMELSVVSIGVSIPIPKLETEASLSFAGINLFSTVNSALLYFLTVTGSSDSLPDIELPMASFQSRRRSGEQTSLSAVIPTVDFAQEIADRSNGTIRIDQGYKKGGVIVQREIIIETDISRADPYEGGNSQSQILTGYSTTNYTPQTVELSTPAVRSVIDGSVRYRVAEPYIFLNPGDTVIIGNDTFICDIMSYAISVDSQTVEIGEA